jgi:hypothetical protein
MTQREGGHVPGIATANVPLYGDRCANTAALAMHPEHGCRELKRKETPKGPDRVHGDEVASRVVRPREVVPHVLRHLREQPRADGGGLPLRVRRVAKEERAAVVPW